jgi:hypothetical protein
MQQKSTEKKGDREKKFIWSEFHINSKSGGGEHNRTAYRKTGCAKQPWALLEGLINPPRGKNRNGTASTKDLGGRSPQMKL